jgi:hypothetical protein
MPISDISRQGRHHRHVHVYLPFESRDRFMATVPSGLTVTLYSPVQTDPRVFIDKNEVNLTIVANENEPDPSFRRYKHDIDSFLSAINTIDNRIRIISDSVSTKDQPNLLTDWYLKNEVVLDHPGLDGEMDHLRSKAANVRDLEVKESTLNEMQNKYQEMKSDYVRTTLKDTKKTTKKDPSDNEQIFTVQVGEI